MLTAAEKRGAQSRGLSFSCPRGAVFWYLLMVFKDKFIRNMKWLWKVSRGFRLRILLYTVVGVANSFLGVQSILAIKRVVDIATLSSEGSLNWSIFIAVALLLLRLAVDGGLSMFNSRTVSPLANHIRHIVMEEILNSDSRQSEKFSGGDVITRCNNDAGAATILMAITIPTMVVNISKLVIYVVSMFLLDVPMAIAALCILPISVSFTWLFAKKAHATNRSCQKANSDDASFIQECLKNILTIKSYRYKPGMLDKMDRIQTRLQTYQIRQNDISVASSTVSKLGFNAGYFLSLLVGVIYLTKGTATFGTITAFLQMLTQIETLIPTILSAVTGITSSFAQVDRILELCTLTKESTEPEIPVQEFSGIQISHVDFSYHEDEPVFRDLCCFFKAGKMTAVVGKTGSGKTTLVHLLLAFLQPSCGSIAFSSGSGAQPISPQTRCNFAFVSHSNAIFDDSIRNNIRLAREDVTDEQIITALRHAQADFVFDLPDGLDTRLNSHINAFSTGQLQRLIIARALCSDSPILLFDEATSALDYRMEERVLQNIRQYYPNRTCIFITHSNRLAQQCDEVFAIKDKKLHLIAQAIA